MGSRIRSNADHLFECFCEVKAAGEPRIARVYPESYGTEDIIKSVPKFVYPCEITTGFSRFSFVLTCIDSKWIYGYCRHEPNATVPTALVFLSYLPVHDILYKLLEKMAQAKRRIETTVSNNLINISDEIEDYSNKFPAEFISILDEHYEEKPPVRKHHVLPSIPENVNLTEYICAMDNKHMIAMLAALLHERRIIVHSKRPCRLSACVQAANDLLYPLVWQHIFIPVLPKYLSDCLFAPMPYLIGVPESVFKAIRLEEIGEVVVFDVDNNSVNTPFDDTKALPSELVSSLQKKLETNLKIGDSISREFLRTITYIIGGYRDALKWEDGALTFDWKSFVKSRGPSMKPFLEELITLQTFRQFLEDRIALIRTGAIESDEFEKECCHFETQSKSTRIFGKKLHLSGIVKQVKEKTQPAMETAVESMKSGVRSVVKGINHKVDSNSHGEKLKPPRPRSSLGSSRSNSINLISESEPSGSKDSHFYVDSLYKSDSHYISPKKAPAQCITPPSPLSPLLPSVLLSKSTPLPHSPSHNVSSSFFASEYLNNPTNCTQNLIQLDEEELLQEYGLDFEKFNISRRNWTTFDDE